MFVGKVVWNRLVDRKVASVSGHKLLLVRGPYHLGDLRRTQQLRCLNRDRSQQSRLPTGPCRCGSSGMHRLAGCRRR